MCYIAYVEVIDTYTPIDIRAQLIGLLIWKYLKKTVASWNSVRKSLNYVKLAINLLVVTIS